MLNKSTNNKDFGKYRKVQRPQRSSIEDQQAERKCIFAILKTSFKIELSMA
jgi:hypothetical protein